MESTVLRYAKLKNEMSQKTASEQCSDSQQGSLDNKLPFMRSILCS